MAIHFTPAQQKVLDARGHNILVSAAAGSGKTAVLVERIVRLVSEGDDPADIDHLLVVTFTRAAAAQMRERIGQALDARLREDPENTHLQRQEVLLHNAQITTMDSFFTFLLRNYFSDIDLDPGFRQIDATESDLLAAEVLQDFLEEKYREADPAFMQCVSYFSPGTDDRDLVDLIRELCDRAGSHPCPDSWLWDRAADYDVPDEGALFATPWMQSLVLRLQDMLLESDSVYEAMKEVCRQPDGPDVLLPFFEEEQTALFSRLREISVGNGSRDLPGTDASDPCRLSGLWEEIRSVLSHSFARYPALRGKKYDYIDPGLRKTVKSMRDAEKDRITNLEKKIGGQSVPLILAAMEAARGPMRTLADLAADYRQRLQEVKKERHVIDFVDLEHFALDILAERQEDGTYVPRRAAQALRSHYAEILIDEYQDSNEVQELMLRIISGEDEGRNNRFMVGDIKQSIYRFRLARPEIFMEKYDTYRPDDPQTERIELDQNFRSRGQVLDCVNALFMRIMRREIGGVDYNDHVSLKKGASFPDEAAEETRDPAENGPAEEFLQEHASDPYMAELLLLDTAGPEEETPEEEASGKDKSGEALPAGEKRPRKKTGGGTGRDERGRYPEGAEDPAVEEEETSADGIAVLADEIGALTDRQKEALLIAGRIRDLVGVLQVRDEDTGRMRPARYGDIVILVRSTVGWNEDLRAVFEREGIPAYAESRTGYFAAREIRVLIGLLRTLDNPLQDIPLYGTLHGYFGDFSQDEIAAIRLAAPDGLLYEALCAAAGETGTGSACNTDGQGPGPRDTPQEALRKKCADFLAFLRGWRDRVRCSTIAEIVTGLLDETGYEDYCTALPAGAQRAANLRFLRNQADAFTKTDMTGLFQFLQYIDGLKRQEIDYGEPNTLDESADVVRIMSIHKSKGLEFPVCFVAGLSKAFSFRRFDTSGPMLFDSDWGCGIHYFDTASRVRCTTLRREEIAEKIRRDCMGEELRVLYVAMTRAKEKLILTASMKGMSDKIADWRTRMAGHFHHADTLRLSPFMIAGASSYLQQILEAVFAHAGEEADLTDLLDTGDAGMSGLRGREEQDIGDAGTPGLRGREGQDIGDAGTPGLRGREGQDMEGAGTRPAARRGDPFPLRIRLCTTGDLTMQAAGDQMDLARAEEVLRGMEGRTLADQPDPEAAQALADSIFRIYPHEELKGLYAQTSVSEIKHRAMHAALRQMEEGSPETADSLFPDPVPVPYVPDFIAREMTTRQAEAGRGARIGTAFHRVLELMDYRQLEAFTREGPQGAEALQSWIDSLPASDRMKEEETALVDRNKVMTFLRSPLAARMAAAEAEGRLYREQPFVMGVPADRLDKDFPAEEIVTVQGIIDAFFIEEKAITLVDYKTDRIRTADELILRYRTQVDLYAEALENSFGLPVREKILYSTALGAEIRL